MLWVFWAILANFGWSIVNILDKFIIGKKIRQATVYYACLVTLAALTALILIPFVQYQIVPKQVVFLHILDGFFAVAGTLFYLKALQKEEVSRINIWWGLIPVFALVIGWLAIGDELNTNQLISFSILVTATFVASVHAKKQAVKFSKGIWWMIVSTFSFACGAVVARYIVQDISPITVLINGTLAAFAWSLLMYFYRPFRKDVFGFFKRADRKTVLSLFLVNIFDVSSSLFYIFALVTVPAAIASSVTGLQVLFVFALALLVTRFRPSMFKEATDKRNIILKVTSLFLFAIGIVIVSFA